MSARDGIVASAGAVMRTLTRCAAAALLGVAAGNTVHANGVLEVREIVHAYPPNGPAEVVGTVPGNRVLRTMQRYSMPAFTDLLALHVAHTLQGASDRPVAIRRIVRGHGVEAAIMVSAAPADGRSVLLASRVPVMTRATETWRTVGSIDLRAVGLVATMPYVVITQAPMPLELHRLTTRRRAPDARVLVASAGERTASHAVLAHLRARHGSAIEPIAYNGGSAALQALAVQEVSAALVPLPAALPYLGGDRLRVLAVADGQRHPILPTVETTAEAGLQDVQVIGWFGVFTPRATPAPVIGALEALLAHGPAALESQEVFASFGLRLEHAAGAAFERRVAFRPADY